MTKTVILIRHAKSSWADPMADDFERVLNTRGRTAAPKIGKWIADVDQIPDVMLVSNAARTVETAQIIRDSWGTDVAMHFEASFYHAAPDTLLDVLQNRPETKIAIVGHNPGIALLAHGLVSDAPDHPRFQDYPTGASTVIKFDGEIEPGRGTCVGFAIPNDMSDNA